MENVPEKIYLQIGEETEATDDFNELCRHGDITWWKERIFKSDIEYQHTAELDRLRAQNAELVQTLKEIMCEMPIEPKLALTKRIIEIVEAALDKYE